MPRNDFAIPKTDGQVELTTQNVAYQIPASADVQTVPYEVIICNNSTASIFVRATTGTSSGVRLDEGQSIIIPLAPSEKVFGYSAVDLQTANYSIFNIA